MKKIYLLLIILIATRVVAQNKDYMLSMQGLGSLKLGMRQDEIEKILNQQLKIKDAKDTVDVVYSDTAKVKYKTIPVQLEFHRTYNESVGFHMRLIGIKASSPLCKTESGIGVGSDKLSIINTYDDYSVNIQQGYVNYYETEKGKGKSTISVTDDSGQYMIRWFLFNNKVISFELQADFSAELTD